MERVFILIGMVVGSCLGLVIAQIIPKATSEAEAMSTVIGAMVGAAGGYLLQFMAKRGERLETIARQTRVYRPQIAGATCVECDVRILLMTDGDACHECDRIVCRQCMDRHPCAPEATSASTGVVSDS